jgi:hypothetical protein
LSEVEKCEIFFATLVRISYVFLQLIFEFFNNYSKSANFTALLTDVVAIFEDNLTLVYFSFRDGFAISIMIATMEAMKESNATLNIKHVRLKNLLAKILNASENNIDVIVSSFVCPFLSIYIHWLSD